MGKEGKAGPDPKALSHVGPWEEVTGSLLFHFLICRATLTGLSSVEREPKAAGPHSMWEGWTCGP